MVFNAKFCFAVSIILVLIVSGCSNKQKEAQQAENTSIALFDTAEAQKTFITKQPAAQWDFLVEQVQYRFSNNQHFETWAINKLPTLKKQKHSINTQNLRTLNEELYHSTYYDLAYEIGHFTLNDFSNKKHREAHATAAAVLCAHYNFLKQKDSLQKHLDILKDGLEQDTAKWVQLAYYSNKGNLADLNGDFFEAAVNYHKCITLTDSKDHKNLSSFNQNLATMYLHMDYIDKALFYMNKSIDYVKNEEFPIENLMTLGIIYYKSGDYDNAEKTYNHILQQAIANKQAGLVAQTYSNLGNLKNKQTQYEEALKYLAMSDSICTDLGIEIGLFINLINRTQVFYALGDYKSTIIDLHKAEAQAKIFENPKINTDIYENLCNAYDAIGNEHIANKYFRLYTENKQKISGDLPRSIIAEWELAKENEKMAKASAAYEATIQKQIKNKILIALILSILLILLSFFYFYKKRKYLEWREKLMLLNQKIKYDLEIKSKEILSESLKNLSVQTTKEWINTELQEIVKDLPRTQQQQFAKLTNKLKSGNNQSYLEEFDIRFTGVYEEFYSKIKTLAPTLTANELRICAMMRLNISSKEIATLTNRTTGTVENIRSNIRKKLNLPADSNLQEFILSV